MFVERTQVRNGRATNLAHTLEGIRLHGVVAPADACGVVPALLQRVHVPVACGIAPAGCGTALVVALEWLRSCLRKSTVPSTAAVSERLPAATRAVVRLGQFAEVRQQLVAERTQMRQPEKALEVAAAESDPTTAVPSAQVPVAVTVTAQP